MTDKNLDKELEKVISEAAQSFSENPLTKGTIWESYLIPNGLMKSLVPALKQLIQDRERGARNNHIFRNVPGGTALQCSCGEIYGTTDEANQHVRWHLELEKDRIKELSKEG